MTSTSTPPTGQQPGQPSQPKTQQIGGLPPTGLQQQLSSMQQQYAAYQSARVPGLGGIGVDVNAGARNNQQSLRAGATGQPGGQQALQATTPGAPQMPMGQTSLQALAQRLASSYGLAVGRDQLVDAAGNFNVTPDQIAASSGGQDTMGTAAAKMNYIAAAIQDQKNTQNMRKSESALQAGLGLTSQRRSGSMIEQQQQFYSQLANLYQNQDREAADFSYFIQKEKMDIESEMLRKAQKLAGKKARTGFWTGVVMTGVGVATGNYWLASQGAGMAYGSSGETGYF